MAVKVETGFIEDVLNANKHRGFDNWQAVRWSDGTISFESFGSMFEVRLTEFEACAVVNAYNYPDMRLECYKA